MPTTYGISKAIGTTFVAVTWTGEGQVRLPGCIGNASTFGSKQLPVGGVHFHGEEGQCEQWNPDRSPR